MGVKNGPFNVNVPGSWFRTLADVLVSDFKFHYIYIYIFDKAWTVHKHDKHHMIYTPFDLNKYDIYIYIYICSREIASTVLMTSV